LGWRRVTESDGRGSRRAPISGEGAIAAAAAPPAPAPQIQHILH
jgi:hypothetical protein